MANQEVLNFIKAQSSKGFSKEEITKVLITQGGWTEEDVNSAYAALGDNVAERVEEPQPAQTASPDVSLQQPSDNLNKKPGKGFATKLLLAVVIGLFLVGGGALAYVGWNHFKPFSETVSVFDAYAKMFELESVSYDFKQSVSSPDSEERADISLVGSISGRDLESFKTDNTYSLRFNQPEGFGALNLEAEIGMRFVDRTIYFSLLKLNDLSEGGMLQFFDLTPFENLWVKIGLDETAEEAENFGFEVNPDEDLKKVEDFFSTLLSKKGEIKKINDRHGFWEVEKMSDQLVAGVDTYTFKTTIDFEALVEAMPEIFEILKDESVFSKEIVSAVKDAEEGFSKEAEEFKKTASELENFELETSVGKEDGYIYRIKNTTEVPIGEIITGADVDTVIIETEILFSKHNQPVEVVAPSEYKTIEELMEGLFMGEPFLPMMMNGVGGIGGDVSVDHIIVEKMKGLLPEAELFYNQNNFSYAGLCESGFKERIDTIAQLVADDATGDCASNPDEWAAFVQLEGGDLAMWYCVDNAGRDLYLGGRSTGARTNCSIDI